MTIELKVPVVSVVQESGSEFADEHPGRPV
jgi:hypothetical protein